MLLALWLLISSSGIVLNKHFCQQQLKNWSLFVEVATCHHKKAAPVCPHHPPPEESKKGCCENKSEFFQLDVEYLITNAGFDLAPLPISATSLWIGKLEINPQLYWPTPTHYLNYKPPLLQYDRPVLLQTFLC